MNFDVTDLLLGVVSLLLAISTFKDRQRKDHRNEGAQEATLHADLKYIKELLQDVRGEIKDLTRCVDQHGERIATCEANIVSAFKSIQRIENTLNIKKEE